MADDNTPDTTDPIAALKSRFGSDPEVAPLLEKAFAASRPASDPPQVSARQGERAFTLTEIAQLRDIFGPGHTQAVPAPAPPTAASGAPAYPVTARGLPPPPHVVTDETPIMSMSPADRQALAKKIGDVKFAERLQRELRSVRVMGRLE